MVKIAVSHFGNPEFNKESTYRWNSLKVYKKWLSLMSAVTIFWIPSQFSWFNMYGQLTLLRGNGQESRLIKVWGHLFPQFF